MLNKKNSFILFLLFAYTISFAQVASNTFPIDTTYTINGQYKKYIKYYPYLIPVKDKLPQGVSEERNVVYATHEKTKYGKRDLHMDIFTPTKDGLYPALILVHGGGWRAGNKSLLVPMAEMIAQKGFVTISVEYQLSLEAPYPAAVYNIKAAIRWLRANAQTYKIDTARIAISGCSSGGHLASLVGLTNGIKHFEGDMGNASFSSSVQAIVDIDGVINFLAPASLNKTRNADSPDVQWLGGTFNQIPETWKDASPIYWANENSVPILFLNSGYSRFHAGQDELIGMLKEWGIYYEVHKFNVQMHTFWLFHPFVDETVDYIADFLNKTLK